VLHVEAARSMKRKQISKAALGCRDFSPESTTDLWAIDTGKSCLASLSASTVAPAPAPDPAPAPTSDPAPTPAPTPADNSLRNRTLLQPVSQ
jgi:hypothetical protein